MTDTEGMLCRLLRQINMGVNSEGEVKALTSGGGNYTSALFSLYIPSMELRLFAKVAKVGEILRGIMHVEHLFRTEHYVYTKIAEIFKDLQERHHVQAELRFVFPKFYACNLDLGEETVILEDLSVRGFESHNRLEPVGWEHARSAVATLARFHALSFAFQAEFPEEFQVAIETVVCKPYAVDDDSRQACLEIVNRTVEVLTDKTHKEKMAKFLYSETCFVDNINKFIVPSSVVVLAHGDYKHGNLLFRELNGNQEIIVVDYQTVHPGCPVSDLLRFVFIGTDENFRAKHHHQLLEHYYSELTSALHRVNIDINDVYPRVIFESELKEKLPLALCMSAVVLPLVMVDETNAPNVCGDADISTFSLEPSELFAQRFNGIVRDCVRWGVI